ncbi:MAG: hypothetical protein L0Y56_20225, partial [Nitrospira sp.]|nr:hypothetical protein [Nitrospira sp.]
MLRWTVFFLAIQFVLGYSDPVLRPAAADPPPQQNTKDPLFAYLDPKKLFLQSDAALSLDGHEGHVLFEKKMHVQRPIASLTKLMTAMIILDANLPLEEIITITKEDRDWLLGSGSKLSFGTQLT